MLGCKLALVPAILATMSPLCESRTLMVFSVEEVAMKRDVISVVARVTEPSSSVVP